MAENPRIEQLRRRVQGDPSSIAFAALAEEYRREGRYPEAIETCRLGLQRHPAYLSARVTLGRSLIGVGDYAAARLELEAVLRAAPENLAAIRAMADIYSRLRDFEEMPPRGFEEIAPEDAGEPAIERAAAEAPPVSEPIRPVVILAPEPASLSHEAAPERLERLEKFLSAITAARAALG